MAYKAEFVTAREAWSQLVFRMGDSNLVQSYEWGEFRRYAGSHPTE